MRKFLLSLFVLATATFSQFASAADDFQLTNNGFEDWSGAAFDGNIQPAGWNASNVTQFGFKFNFAHREAGHTGQYSMMVQDQSVGAAGISETSPGYFSLGQPWVYIKDLFSVSEATAGTYGGISFKHRPDTMSVWIKRTGSDVTKEDFYLLFYAWSGAAKGQKYMGKNEKCTTIDQVLTNEESDVRQALDGNVCGTTTLANQICEGMWREKKQYGSWTNIRVPIYYMKNDVPTTMNIIFSASNYPNFRANSGLYEGNSLYVDDVELIYSSAIQKLYIGDKEWKGFDPSSTEVQYYSLGETATSIPSIEAIRGAGSLTNARGTTANFNGRTLSGSEITITQGDLENTPTLITVKSEDGKSTTTYKIQFQRQASSNAKLAGIYVNGELINGFSPAKYNYTVDLPYGTTATPVVSAEGQEDKQVIDITQPQSINGTSSILVTAANGTSKATYTLNFRVAALADNTLQDILVNGKSIPGFTPTQTVYKVSLPTSTTEMPVITAVSAYPDGAQTIVHNAPSQIDGGTYTLSVTTPGNTIAKVYKLNFKLEASSYTLLKDLQVEGGYIANFDPENFTYYINLPLGTVALPNITWVPGDEYQTITMTEGGLDGTTRIVVTAGNGDQSVYKLVFSTEKSDISTLAGIKIGGEPIPGFKADSTSYTWTLPVGTTELPEIEPIPGDEFQTIAITYGGVNGKTRITVTAGDGSTTIYQIAFSVTVYSDNTLKGIYLDGTLIEGFNGEKDEYFVNLPQGTTTLPEVTYELQNSALQTATVRTISGLSGDYKITVRPQSGASRTYIIHFSVATSNNTALRMIYVGGVELEGFNAETTDYSYRLPEGVSTIPSVTFDKAESSQRVLSVLENKVQTITVTAESGDKRVYTITFIVQVSQNAFLDMIYLDGDSLEGFDKQVLNYTVQLATAKCPAITVDKAAGQQVTITAPYGAGDAQIKVQPEEGSSNIYVIHFEAIAATTARLADILVDGASVDGFDPAVFSYSVNYEKVLPNVSYVKGGADQTVTVLWKDSVAWLHVVDAEGNKAAYSVTFHRILSANNTLQAILIDGTPMSEFDAATLNYTRELAAGSSYPEVSYIAADDAQVVFFGQLTTGKWGITVSAENGQLATYTVQFNILPYSDATLANLKVEGYSIDFDPDSSSYSLSIDEGAALPEVIVTSKPGQTVLSLNVSDTEQQVIVTAEDGTQNTYVITYARKLSDNAKLENILIDGANLLGFHPDTLHYSVALPRTAKVVPNVFPVAQLENQTITTYFSRPNGTTRIHVVAQNGAEANYTIDFPVQKSANTKLGELMINGENKDVNTTEYEFELPYGSTEPYEVSFEKAEAEQLIDYTAAPINGVTKIIVKAENGDTRTYSIRYTVAQPQGENNVKRVDYSYINASGDAVEGSLVPVSGNNIVNLPFGSQSFEVTNVEKNFDAQTIVFYNGGIRRGATIIASANREGVQDVTYTITPQMPTFETAGKLESLKFKNVLVPNFRPDVYNYMINVTTQPTAADFSYTAYDGKTVTPSSLNVKKKQITFSVEGGETYSVCWYYTNYDKLLDFSGDWVAVSQGVGYKPSNQWKVPADCDDGYTWSISLIGLNLTYTTGKEVTPGGANGAMLSTLRGAPMNGSVPGMMTLGAMAVNLTSTGNSTSSVTKNATVGAEFKNTPEAFAFLIKPLSTSNITNWKMWLTMSDGTNYKESNYTGNFDALNKWFSVSVPINYSGVGTVSKFNVMLSSCDQENAKQFGGSTVYESSVIYDQIHFVYNSELTAATVNGKETTKSGNTFTYTLEDNEVIMGVPALKFTGAVQDQTQTIEWQNNGEWINGQLTAKVTNYGENSTDNTVYFVVLQRDPVTTLEYTADFGTYATFTANDTTFVSLPYGIQTMPDITINPESVHQHFVIAKNGKCLSVTVSAEDGGTNTHVYAFRETKTNTVALAGISATDAKGATVELTPAYTPEQTTYTVTAERMPIVAFEKMRTADDHEMGQTVALTYTNSSAQLLVTAADGKTQRTYTINRLDPTITTNAQISEFEIGGNVMSELGGTTFSCEKERPAQAIFFTRHDATDSVVFVQDQQKMQWLVYGTEGDNTYTLTYPTTQSGNTDLANIKINGEDYKEFQPYETEYTIYSDSTVWVEAIAAEPKQKIATSLQLIEGGVIYTSIVTAENGATKTYTITVRAPKSNIATLAGIMLDSVMISDFDPEKSSYTVVLPTPAVKTALPKMPSIAYVVGQKGQTVVIEPAQLGEQVNFTVTSEDGSAVKYYDLTVLSEPSHCVDLTGITVNGVALDHFESGRHFYSVSLKTSEVDIDYAADDRFQTVTVNKNIVKPDLEFIYVLNVLAEDGVTSADYQIEVYVENLSNDAQLANILLNGKDFVDFERALNADLTFDGGNNNYEINLPSGTTVLPEVSAQLKMDGQSVSIDQRQDSILLHVTAVDGQTTNTYVLRFIVPLSKNADLSMIFLNGDSLQGFDPTYYFYQVNLPVGVHQLPEVAAQKGEAGQTVLPIEMDVNKLQATIHVQAEDPTTRPNTYVIVFHYTQSDADTLAMIYEDGAKLIGYNPQTFYYTGSLPVGTVAFPDLSWEEADDWQQVHMDTVSMSAESMIRQIIVTSESGRKNTYTISYTIEKSSVDSLQMIFVDQKQLPDFKASQTEYFYTLSAAYATELDGHVPTVEYITGDEYQSVFVSQVRDSIIGKSLGYKSIVTVTAATGATRIYTIHYPVELSTDATLNMINLGGKPLSNYDSERFNYKVDIDMEASVPVVSVIKREEAQTYEIQVVEDTVLIIVTAEDVDYQQTYTLIFQRQMSSITKLSNIILSDEQGTTLPPSQFLYRPETYEYTVDVPYDATKPAEDQLPDMEVVYMDPQQSSDTSLYVLPNGDIRVDITVTAPNGEDQAIYSLTFHFVRPSDATLTSIMVNDVLLSGFQKDVTEYDYTLPFGSTTDDFLTLDSISYILSDSLAEATAYIDEDGTIFITVVAQDGTTEMTYIIRQTIGKDNDNALLWIALDNVTIRDFDPDVTFYTYYLMNGTTPPSVAAEPRSENAELSIREVSAGDTCTIICTAADGSERRYYIHFAVSTLDDALIPTANDVILRRVPGSMQLFAGTIRKDVSIALYDQNGHLLYCNQVPVSDPNDADVSCGADGKDHLNNVIDTRSGLLIDIVPAQVYFYTFFVAEKEKITSGKIMALP